MWDHFRRSALWSMLTEHVCELLCGRRTFDKLNLRVCVLYRRIVESTSPLTKWGITSQADKKHSRRRVVSTWIYVLIHQNQSAKSRPCLLCSNCIQLPWCIWPRLCPLLRYQADSFPSVCLPVSSCFCSSPSRGISQRTLKHKQQNYLRAHKEKHKPNYVGGALIKEKKRPTQQTATG